MLIFLLLLLSLFVKIDGFYSDPALRFNDPEERALIEYVLATAEPDDQNAIDALERSLAIINGEGGNFSSSEGEESSDEDDQELFAQGIASVSSIATPISYHYNYNSPFAPRNQNVQAQVDELPLAPNEDIDFEALLMNAAMNVVAPQLEEGQMLGGGNAGENVVNTPRNQIQRLIRLQGFLNQNQRPEPLAPNPAFVIQDNAGENVLATPPQQGIGLFPANILRTPENRLPAARRLFQGSPLQREVSSGENRMILVPQQVLRRLVSPQGVPVGSPQAGTPTLPRTGRRHPRDEGDEGRQERRVRPRTSTNTNEDTTSIYQLYRPPRDRDDQNGPNGGGIPIQSS